MKASPLAEKVAADLGIDLRDVKAAHGRVLAEDLLRYIAETREKAAGRFVNWKVPVLATVSSITGSVQVSSSS